MSKAFLALFVLFLVEANSRTYAQGREPFGGGSQPDAPVLDPYVEATASYKARFTGRAKGGAFVVEVCRHGAAPVATVPVLDERFAVDVGLNRDQINALYFTSVSESGRRSAPTLARITQDSAPPELVIDFPAEGEMISEQAVTVLGRVGDALSGDSGILVTVNGVEAQVFSGLGNNGTFVAEGIDLNAGRATKIRVAAEDAFGHSVEQIRLVCSTVPNGPYMSRLGEGNLSAQVYELLDEPIRVQVLEANGEPFVGKVVTFEILRSDGLLKAVQEDDGKRMLQVITDNNGVAEVLWRLGGDTGKGNNRLVARSTSIAGELVFCASALPGLPSQINISSGSRQTGEAGELACEQLVVRTSDGCNGVGGVPVSFQIVSGGGEVNGTNFTVAETNGGGYAAVSFRFGVVGTQVVRATFEGNPNNAAAFILRAVQRGSGLPTSLSGRVFDNAERPIGASPSDPVHRGAECTLLIGGNEFGPVYSDLSGRFTFEDLPVGGPAILHVDGAMATYLGGSVETSVPEGSFPALEFEIVVVPNTPNELDFPVLLPELNPSNVRYYSTTETTILEVEGIQGLRMLVRPGSMFLGHDHEPAPDGTPIALNQVHHDDVPMPMPDGAAPPFAWTLQPAGAFFDPPIEITYPNMSGLPPHAVSYFLSFNHSTGRFEIIGTGVVSEDGSCIVSEEGSGLSIAGWGCNCPPYSVTGACEGNCTDTLARGESDATTICVDQTLEIPIAGEGVISWTIEQGASRVAVMADQEARTLLVTGTDKSDAVGDVAITIRVGNPASACPTTSPPRLFTVIDVTLTAMLDGEEFESGDRLCKEQGARIELTLDGPDVDQSPIEWLIVPPEAGQFEEESATPLSRVFIQNDGYISEEEQDVAIIAVCDEDAHDELRLTVWGVIVEDPSRGPGLPLSIPYSSPGSLENRRPLAVEFCESLDGQSVRFEIVSKAAGSGEAVIRGADVLTGSGVIEVVGTAQTGGAPPVSSESAGGLFVRATLNGVKVGESEGFSVCAHPAGMTLDGLYDAPTDDAFPCAVSPDECTGGEDNVCGDSPLDPHLGIVVAHTVLSDSGNPDDLTGIFLREVLDKNSETSNGCGINAVSFRRDECFLSGWLCTIRGDRHYIVNYLPFLQQVDQACLAGVNDYTRDIQLHEFYDLRCGMSEDTQSVFPQSGFTILTELVGGGLLSDTFRLTVTKSGTAAGVCGRITSPGSGSYSRTIEVVLSGSRKQETGYVGGK